jgi:hypothetical protein
VKEALTTRQQASIQHKQAFVHTSIPFVSLRTRMANKKAKSGKKKQQFFAKKGIDESV